MVGPPVIQKKLLVSQSAIRDRSVDALQEGQQIAWYSAAPYSHVIVKSSLNTGFFRRKPILSATFKYRGNLHINLQYIEMCRTLWIGSRVCFA